VHSNFRKNRILDVISDKDCAMSSTCHQRIAALHDELTTLAAHLTAGEARFVRERTTKLHPYQRQGSPPA
jgi:hypothetical protein